MTTLEDRTALVTGGGSGIGAACARRLARGGARVLVVDRNPAAAEQIAAEITQAGQSAAAHVADVADEDSVRAMVQAADDHFGGLDLAVNNAGVSMPPTPIRHTSLEDWRRVLSVNLDGVFLCLREEINALRGAGGGAIVNMATVLGVVSAPGLAAYSAAKAGVISLTRTAALEGATHGIRVNAVAPGFIETPLLDEFTVDAVRPALLGRIPARRFGTPEEVAELVAWLLSEEAGYVTGSCHGVDGGYLAG